VGTGDPPSAKEAVDIAKVNKTVATIKRTIFFIVCPPRVINAYFEHPMCILRKLSWMFENRAIEQKVVLGSIDTEEQADLTEGNTVGIPTNNEH
jgi:hypothetical protein